MGDRIHHGAAHRVAEEGSFAASVSTLPVLQYFPCRGRAEPIRLVLSYVRQPWFEPPPASVKDIYTIMHQELDGYPFRQLPRFIDEVHGDVDLVQSQAIMRHLGRKYDLYGKDLAEAGRIDMVMDAVSELRAKIRALVVERQLDVAAVDQYLAGVMATVEELKGSSMTGPGLASLEYLLSRRRYSEAGWLVGHAPSLADFAAFDLTDLHLAQPQLAETLRSRFPALAAHHAKVAELQASSTPTLRPPTNQSINHPTNQQATTDQPINLSHETRAGVSEYLASDSRHAAVWAVDWLRQHRSPRA